MDGREALRIIASEVVGVSNPDDVHDAEMLPWHKIREALENWTELKIQPTPPVVIHFNEPHTKTRDLGGRWI